MDANKQYLLTCLHFHSLIYLTETLSHSKQRTYRYHINIWNTLSSD